MTLGLLLGRSRLSRYQNVICLTGHCIARIVALILAIVEAS